MISLVKLPLFLFHELIMLIADVGHSSMLDRGTRQRAQDLGHQLTDEFYDQAERGMAE